jgi:hypothetical protein
MSEICWRSGVPIEGEREGENRSFRDRKGKVFPACEPREGHFGSAEAKGQWCLLETHETPEIYPLEQRGIF